MMQRSLGTGERDGAQDRRTARMGLALWLAALVVGTGLFHALGHGPLSPPPLDPAGWGRWAEGRDPLIATFAVLRLLVLALSWYLVGVTSIGILARLLRAARLVTLADALTVPALRRTLQAALGVTLATAMVASAVPTPDPGVHASATVTPHASGDGSGALVDGSDSDLPATLTAVGDEAGEGDRITLEHVEGGSPLPLELLERSRAAARDTAVAVDESPDEPVRGEAAVPGEAVREPLSGERASQERVVAAGDSLWTIAHDVLGASLERVPTATESAVYWRILVEANRDRLVDRENADLIFPGQVLAIPADGLADRGAG